MFDGGGALIEGDIGTDMVIRAGMGRSTSHPSSASGCVFTPASSVLSPTLMPKYASGFGPVRGRWHMHSSFQGR